MNVCIHPERETGVTPEELVNEIMSLTADEKRQLLDWWKNKRVTQS